MNADSTLNQRAQRALLRRHAGTSGLCWHADPRRQVVHVAIGDGTGAGSALTFNAEEFAGLIRGLLAVEIDTLPLEYTRTHSSASLRRFKKRAGMRAPLKPYSDHTAIMVTKEHASHEAHA